MLAWLGQLLFKIVVLLGVSVGLKEAWNRLLTPDGRQSIINLLTNIMSGVFAIARPVLTAAEGELQPIVAAFADAIGSYGGPVLETIRTPLVAYARDAYNLAVAGLVTQGESTPDNAIQTAATAFADAAGFGIGSAGVAAAFEAAFPKSLNVLDSMAPLLSKMAGFDEAAAAVRDPLYDAAFGQSLRYHFRSVFKPELPDEGDAITWHARGLLTDDQLKVIFNYSGLKTEYEAPFIASAYRAISPFMVLRAMESGAITDTQADQLLGFYGARSSDIDAMKAAYAIIALAPYESKVVAAAERAYQMGDIGESEFSAALARLHLPPGAESDLVLAVQYGKLVQLTELYRKSVSEGYQYGTVSDADYITTMEAAGIAESDAAAHYAVDSIKKHGKDAIAAARAEARDLAELRRAEVKAATASFIAQQIDAAAFAALLASAGVPPAIVPFALQVATIRRDGRKTSVYGRLVTHGEAILLREEVAQIKERVIKKLLSPEQAYRQVLAQSVPTLNAQALVEQWAAEAKEPWTPPPA